MIDALPAPEVLPLLTQWSWQPIAIIALVALAWWYLHAVRQLVAAGGSWPVHRSVIFGFGLLVGLWSSCGFYQAYLNSMYWAWTSQVLLLLLLVPTILLTGQPVQLALATSGPSGWLARFLESPPARFLSRPLVGPALLPVLSAALFFGPLPMWAITIAPLQWVLQIVLVVLGCLILLPLVAVDKSVSSMAVGLTLALGFFELMLDAVPGIVLRLHHSLVSSYFEHRALHPWSKSHLHDQRTAGTILWVVCEIIDLPFLLLLFRRWMQADERDAAVADAVLDAEHAARAGSKQLVGPESARPLDAPWWLSDPTMQARIPHDG